MLKFFTCHLLPVESINHPLDILFATILCVKFGVKTKEEEEEEKEERHDFAFIPEDGDLY